MENYDDVDCACCSIGELEKDTGHTSSIGELENDNSIDIYEIGSELIGVINVPESSKIVIPAKNIIILDKSGSMGSAVGTILEKIMPQSGLAKDSKISLVTFSNISENVTVEGRDPTLKELSKLGIRASGTTNMIGIFPLLEEILKTVPKEQTVKIIIISDGDINDQLTVLPAAKACQDAVKKLNLSISVTMIRLFTSSSQPDTRALACIGCLHTAPTECKLHDIAIRDEQQLLNIVQEGLRPVSSLSTITSDSKCLRPFIFKELTDTLSLPSGPQIILLSTKPTLLTIDDKPIIQHFCGPLGSEKIIHSLLVEIENKLKLLMLNNFNIEETKKVFEWLSNLAKFIEANKVVIPACSQEKSLTPFKEKIKVLLRTFHKQERTLLISLLQLKNQDNVSSLNSANSAYFLRTTGSVQLAKRVFKTSPGSLDFNQASPGSLDFNQASSNDVNVLASQTIIERKTDETSFISLASTAEILKSAQDLVKIRSELTLEQILSIIGATGICVNIEKSDCIDPWNVEVNQIFLGLYANEPDLWGQESLAFPGTTENCNAIIPLRDLNPIAYDIYYKFAPNIASYQASMSIRGLIAPVPGDAIALAAAALYRMITQIGLSPRIPECDIKIVDALISQNGWKLDGYCKGIIKDLHLRPHEFEGRISTDNGITGILKPLITLLTTPGCADIRADSTKFQALLKVLLGFKAYVIIRNHFKRLNDAKELRSKEINKILDIPVDVKFEIGEPFTQDTHLDKSACVVDIPLAFQQAASLGFIDTSSIIGELPIISRFVESTSSASSSRFPLVEDLSSVADTEIYSTTMIIHGLQSTCEGDRIDTVTNTSKGPNLNDKSGCVDFLNRTKHDIISKLYNLQLQAKRNTEAAITLTRLIDHLIECPNIEEFIQLLQRIKNRFADGYEEFANRLSNSANHVPLRAEKLWVSILGLHPDSHQPVWAEGNVLRECGKYRDVFIASSSSELWDELEKFIQACVYKYRIEPPLNRHGYGNSNPSEWAQRGGKHEKGKKD